MENYQAYKWYETEGNPFFYQTTVQEFISLNKQTIVCK